MICDDAGHDGPLNGKLLLPLPLLHAKSAATAAAAHQAIGRFIGILL